MKNKRYINVHLHLGEDIFNLGMVKIDGSMPAEKALEKVNRVLDRFGVHCKKYWFGSREPHAAKRTSGVVR